MTVKDLYASIDGNYESAKRILQMDALIEKFLPKLLNDKSFSKLQTAMANKDEKELFEASHAMKGVFANLGLDKLSSMASEISEEFRPGKSRTMTDEDLQSRFEALEQKYTTSIQAIQNYLDAKKK
ncbi:MAG: Hpt domain-containing protein [Desulfovibrio sp.]|nr:Hpt domain-containing protein [Desulfovibrio sp.]